MEEAKTLLLSLEFDTDEGLKRAANFRSAIDADKEALAELNKVIKKNGEANEQQLVDREKLEQNIKKNVKARGEEIKKIDDYLKATKNSIDANGKYNGSINNLRGNLAFLTTQWNNLTKEERENAQVGGVLQKEVKRLSDELKNLEGSVGDNRRSVGGYLDAIRQAPGAMGKMRAGIDGIGLAVKANPIGLLVTALAFLPKLLNSSGEGADFFAKTMLIVNAVVQEGLKRLVALGGAAVKLFLGDFKGAFNDGKAALTGFASSIDSAVKSGGALADRLDKLENAESRFAAASSKTKLEIDRLIAQSKNRTLSEKEKEIILERALKMEIELNKQALKLAKERMALIKEENRINQGDEDEEIKRVNEQQEKINDILGQSLVLQERIQARKDANAEAAADREKKRQEKAAKLAEDAAKKEVERLEYIEKQRQAALAQTKMFLDELAALDKKYADLDKKEADDKLEREAFLLSVDIANARAKTAAEEEEAAKRKVQKEKEYQVLVSFTNAASGLAAALANETTALADFQKAVSLFQIGLASAEAYTKGVAASQGLPFPGNIIAMGTTIATIATNLLQAKQFISGGSAPKYKAAEGGILSGPSHAEGGITGTGRFANVEVEGGEAIISKRATALFAPLLSAINIAGGGKPLANTNYAAMGGLLSGTAGRNLSSQVIDYDRLADRMVKAIERMPAPVVSVSRLNQATLEKETRKKQVTLGK